ncbi:hypothetical protein [Polyangium spumosum]|uniref:Uncharacterized protein n=1 Tax=Polyangium spumosum TaxID=889282 RepID=A0A6N7Q6H3_9BACT|nr:hypothetical protein [Polyangium spumosum]MRG98295.1 hypothetical protein [Polyangium spumosum]
MAYDFMGSLVFHAFVRMLNDGELVNHESLYRLGLVRLADRTAYLLDAIGRARAELASVANGTRATLLGSKRLSVFTQYDAETNPTGELGPGGLLDGKTLLLGEDSGPAELVQFAAPMTPADIVQQIKAGAPKNKDAGFDDESRIVLVSKTLGASSSLSASGTAAAILGLPSGTATGTGAIDDGASRIGFFEHGAIPTGTVRSALVGLIQAVDKLGKAKAALAGDTFTGPVTFAGPVTFKSGTQDTIFANAPNADAVLDASTANLFLLPMLTGARTYTLAAPSGGARRVRVVRTTISGFGALFRRQDSAMVGFPPNGQAWAEFTHFDDGTGARWRPTAWGGNVSQVIW